jgi:putative acetyltransferase
VNASAFGRPAEAQIVEALRVNGKVVLSLVAELEGRIVGHALFSRAYIEAESGTRVEAALGPLAVLPERQRRGIGSALVRRGLEECRALGFGAVFLLGDPAYYGRFGFQPARAYGLRYAGHLDRDEAFQAVELRPGALRGLGGVVREEPELG